MPRNSSFPDDLSPTGVRPVNTAIIGRRYLCREALRAVLQSSGLNFFHEAEDATPLLSNVLDLEQPDLLICFTSQYGTPETLLLQVHALRLRLPQMKTILLTDVPVNPAMIQAVQSGVEACLSNDISGHVLQRAVELVLAGQYLFAAEIARHLAEPASPMPEPVRPSATPAILATAVVAPPLSPPGSAPLSKREFEILRHLIEGLPNKTIARALDITEATVKVHIKALLRKTRMANRTQAAIWAMSNGFGLAEDTPATAFPSVPRHLAPSVGRPGRLEAAE